MVNLVHPYICTYVPAPSATNLHFHNYFLLAFLSFDACRISSEVVAAKHQVFPGDYPMLAGNGSNIQNVTAVHKRHASRKKTSKAPGAKIDQENVFLSLVGYGTFPTYVADCGSQAERCRYKYKEGQHARLCSYDIRSWTYELIWIWITLTEDRSCRVHE
jgi:hypothetical protein